MNTYMVEVNAKFLVKIQLDGSCLAAEHLFLDNYDGVWAANAYDEKGMKTECFRDAVLTSEIVSFREFEGIMMQLDCAKALRQGREDEEKRLADKLAELQAEYDRVKAEYIENNTELNKARKSEHEAQEIANWKKV